MGNKKNNKGKFKSGTWVERELYTSRAYLSLTGFAPQLLILFLGKRDMHQVNSKWECKNSKSLTMTYAQLENIFADKKGEVLRSEPKGITKPRIARGFDELLAKGFIEIIRHGGKYQQDKTVYALSKNWRIWRPGVVFERRNKGNQWATKNKID